MFSIHDRPSKLCDGFSRREILRIGGLGLGSLSLPNLMATAQARPQLASDPTFGRAKNVIYLFLAGGPPQHETFDPKPDAPAEVRGPFHPISTVVPGIHFCELLPRTARLADKLAIVRSMATDDHVHSSSGHWVLTGNKYVGTNARTIHVSDWPYFGSIVKQMAPSKKLPALSTVWIPDIYRLNENVTPAGQTGGLLGRRWDPDHFIGDPSAPDYRMDQFQLRGITPMRLQQRMSLLRQIERHFKNLDGSLESSQLDQYQQQAFQLLTSGKVRDAFAIHKESEKVRRRYGNNRWGQCVLLARRLIEAGVRLVHVQWPREPGDNAVDNPLWDTHAQNADRLEDVLCPQFDVGFSALIEDLDQRGLLEETLVVAIGEFGRTPKINSKGGRDHWGHVFSFAMAGAGIAGGQVFGASDTKGGYPVTDRVEPGNLTASIFHLLGIDPQSFFLDTQDRPHRLTTCEPIFKLLGTQPATLQRITPTGSIARVPPYDPDRLLTDTDFTRLENLLPASGPTRPKGWRAASCLLESPDDDRFGVKLISDQSHVAIGFNLGTGSTAVSCESKTTAYIAQEVRSPFAGRYKFIVDACGTANSQEFYEKAFLRNFRCRLVFFQLTELSKRVSDRKELASVEFIPSWSHHDHLEFASFQLEKNFVNHQPGAGFSFGLGMGVAIVVECERDISLSFPGQPYPQNASIRIDQVQLEFEPKSRLDDVKV